MNYHELLGKVYPDRCWGIVRDVYPGVTRISVENADKFERVDTPEDGDVAMVLRDGVVYHCGIAYRGGVFHQMNELQGVIYEPASRFAKLRYYRFTQRSGDNRSAAGGVSAA